MGSLSARLDPRSNSLNFLRLVLAVVVIVSHAWPLGGYGKEPLFGGQTPGTWAVFGFFALSGYLITGSRIANDFMSYLQHRFLRIYPAFTVCLLVTVLVFAPLDYIKLHGTWHGYFSAATSPIDYVTSNLGLKMRAYDVAHTPAGVPYRPHAWTGSLWSLYYEFGCYLVVGLVGCWAVFRRRAAVVIAMFGAVTALRIEIVPFTKFARNPDLLMMVRLLPFFLAGSVVYMLRDRIPCRWWLAALSLVPLVVVPLAFGTRFVVLCALPGAYLLTWLGAVLPIRIGRRHDISYGIYIYGFPVQQLLAIAGLQRHGQVLFTAAGIICTVPFAVASWLLIERPALKLRPRRAHGARATTTPSTRTPTADSASELAAAVQRNDTSAPIAVLKAR